MKVRVFCIVAVLVLVFSMAAVVVPASPALADTLCVNPGGTGGCYSSIQAAIDAADPAGGDTINVAAGTYAESLSINKGLTISGAGAATTSVTGGIVIQNYSGDLKLEGMTLSGGGSPTTVLVSNITIQDCVLDGGDVSGRAAFRGENIDGIWKWDGNEIKNFVSSYVIDNGLPYNLTEVWFTNNDIHDVAGSIAFRGDPAVMIEKVVVSGNTINYSMITVPQAWAAVEVNNVALLQVFDNTVTGVPMFTGTTPFEEGEAFQFWSKKPWTVDIHDNVITGNHMGIWIYIGGIGACYVPTGSVYNNDFVGNTRFGLWVSDDTLFNNSIPPPNPGDILNAEDNWWGDNSGPYHAADNPGGTGDAVSDNVDFDPWLQRGGGGGGTPVETATGTGTAFLEASAGSIENLTPVPEGNVPCSGAGKPNLQFLHGFFEFDITGLTPGEKVIITITLPSPVVAGAQYWKCLDGTWIDVTSILGDNDGDNILTLTITDGGLGDDDHSANGVIDDQGGPATPPPADCFIATAAYGSPMDSHVDTLRDFRDQYLETNPMGEAMVSLYYKYSPPMADFIDEHPAIKPLVRAGLSPAVVMSTVAVNTTTSAKLAILGLLGLISIMLAVLVRRRSRGVERER